MKPPPSFNYNPGPYYAPPGARLRIAAAIILGGSVIIAAVQVIKSFLS